MKKKQNIIKQQIVLWICCFSFLFGQAQPQFLSEEAEISVLTCGTGEEMYALFGHTALRVKDSKQQLDVVYNWGMFDFQTPDFYSRFVKGDLLYYLDVDRFNDFIHHYTLDNREVIEQKLILTYDQKIKIWEEINGQLRSDDRFYTYEFIRNNCTTKVVDVLNKVLEQPLPTDFPSNNHSYRYILNEGLDNHYFEKLGINLLFGYKTDQSNDLIFLPVKLKDAIAYDKEILKSEIKLNQVVVTDKNSFNSIYLLWGMVLLSGIGCFFKKARWIYFFVTALFSLFLLAVSLYSHHIELHFNVLVLFFNPVFWLGLIRKSVKIFVFAVVLSFISLFFMGGELISILLPLIVLHFSYILAFFLIKKDENHIYGKNNQFKDV
ncbi:MAG TPA: DUF4105 domain-containing protein [Flavobacterium sp.]|nr:DUF4105 domain-containing protein [Flavobacterium sp.]